MSITPDADDAPPPIDDLDVYDSDADLDFNGDEDDEDVDDDGTDVDDFDLNDQDAPPPLLDSNNEDVADEDDPDFSDELPGVPLTDEHREYLIAQAIDADYLDSELGQATLRSATEEAHISRRRRSSIEHGKPHTGILFGCPDPTTGKTQWQFRPDFPRKSKDGRLKKYTSRHGGGSPCGVVSHPAKARPIRQTTLIVEGTKQSRATAAALAHDPSFVVVAMSGKDGWIRDNNLQPVIHHAVKGAESVVIMLDADAATNRSVYDAGISLKEALKPRLGAKRGRVNFARVPGSGNTGIDDILADLPKHERAAYVQELIDDALPTPADKRPKGDDATSGDRDLDKYFSRYDGGIKPKACAEYIVENTHLAIDSLTDDLLVWNSETGLYEKDVVVGGNRVSSTIGGVAVDLLGDHYSGNRVSDIEFITRKMLKQRGRVVVSLFGDTGGRVPFKNGLFNPETSELEPFTPDLFVTTKLNVNYNPEAAFAAIPEWIKSNTRLSDGIDQFEVLLDVISGLFDSMTGKCPAKVAVLFGKSRSSKGTFVNNLLLPMIDPRFVTATGLVELSRNERFDNAELYGKLLSLTGELPEHFIRELSVFKMATGGDPIPASFKFRPFFTFQNQALFVMSGNNPPNISDPTNAAQNRMVPIYYPISHADNEDFELADRLYAEIEGLAYALLQSWMARRARGGRYLPPHPEARANLSASMNPVSGFVKECLRLATEDDWVKKNTVRDECWANGTTLYDFYTAYMARVGRKGVMLRDNFLRILTSTQFNVQEARNESVRARGYSAGIAETEMVEMLIDRNPWLVGSSTQKRYTPKPAAATDEPPLDEPVEVVSLTKESDTT